MWGSIFYIGAVQLRSVREIAPQSPFLCVNTMSIRYGFRADARAMRHSVNMPNMIRPREKFCVANESRKQVMIGFVWPLIGLRIKWHEWAFFCQSQQSITKASVKRATMQKRKTCFAVLQLNESKSDVARFTIRVFNLVATWFAARQVWCGWQKAQ